MSTIICPHCGVANPSGGAFCASCGMALPSAVRTPPRVIGKSEFASTAEGVRLQGDELHTLAKRAGNTMLTIAVCTGALCAIAAAAISSAPHRPGVDLSAAKAELAIYGILAAIFFALYLWSRKDPLPPAIVGLVLYVTLAVVQIVALTNASSARQADGMGRASPTATVAPSVIIVKIFFIYMFIRAIQAGIQHRKLMRLQTTQTTHAI